MTKLKPLSVWIKTNCGIFLMNIHNKMGITEHITCLLRNLYAGQEATVGTGHGTNDWFEIRKGVCQGCILLPCFINLYAEYIMQNARMNESQAGIKIVGRNIKNLRYVYDTTLMAESGGELKSLLMQVKEDSEKTGLKQKSKNKDHGMQSNHLMENRWGKCENSVRFHFLGLKITVHGDCSHKMKCTCSLEEYL